MAETPTVMPSLHMPLQSGSDKVLKDMRRSYRQSKFLGIIDRVRAAIPDAAITTDIIVGFPGETEEDFLETMKVVEQARFAGAFTFQYSKRPGTPAAVLEDQVPKAVVQERYMRLVELADQVAWDENKRLVGQTVELMVAEGEGRKDTATHRLSGRAPRQPAGALHARGPGRSPRSTYAPATWSRSRSPTPRRTTWSPTAPVTSVRRTRAGDAWENRTAPKPHGRLARPADRRRPRAAAGRGRGCAAALEAVGRRSRECCRRGSTQHPQLVGHDG